MFARFFIRVAIVLVVSIIPMSPQMTMANNTVSPVPGLHQPSLLAFQSPIRVFQAAGPSAESIQSNVDRFRAELGEPDNGNNPGPLTSGRREINWDGGGATTATPVGTPFAGFQNIRGALFTTPGTGFLQTPLDAPELLSINPALGDAFRFFSPLRIFVPIGDNIVDVFFFVPGTVMPGPPTPATVKGFGAIFTDVDLSASTKIEYFDPSGSLLFANFVPASPGNKGLSFLGVEFADKRVFRVRITSGNVPLGPVGSVFGLIGQTDSVGMDDFIFGEPQAQQNNSNKVQETPSAL